MQVRNVYLTINGRRLTTAVLQLDVAVSFYVAARFLTRTAKAFPRYICTGHADVVFHMCTSSHICFYGHVCTYRHSRQLVQPIVIVHEPVQMQSRVSFFRLVGGGWLLVRSTTFP